MQEFAFVGIVSNVSLLVYYFTLFKAGSARSKFQIKAPAHSGPPEYERYVRAHQNTLEHLVLFLPGLWLFAWAVDPLWAAGIGAIWPLARLWYAIGYYRSAEGRVKGLILSMPPIYILILGSLVGFLLKILH